MYVSTCLCMYLCLCIYMGSTAMSLVCRRPSILSLLSTIYLILVRFSFLHMPISFFSFTPSFRFSSLSLLFLFIQFISVSGCLVSFFFF